MKQTIPSAIAAAILAACSGNNAAKGTLDGGAGKNAGSDAGGACVLEDAGRVAAALIVGEVAPDEFGSDVINDICILDSRCGAMSAYFTPQCTTALLEQGVFWFPTAKLGDGANTYGQVFISGFPSAQEAAVEAGRASYNTTLAYQCFQEIAFSQGAPLCIGGQAVLPLSCEAAFFGTVPDGGNCLHDFECDAGVCIQAADCIGVCQPGPPDAGNVSELGLLGAPCADPLDPPCPSGTTCASGICRGSAAAGSNCQLLADCQPGLYCAAGVCQPQVASGVSCAMPVAGVEGICSAPDQTCVGYAPLLDGGTAMGTCRPWGDLGASCPTDPAVVAFGATGYLPGLVCTCGQCVLAPTSGSCASGAECAFQVSSCRGGQCVSLAQVGGECALDQDCASQHCDGTLCSYLPPPTCP